MKPVRRVKLLGLQQIHMLDEVHGPKSSTNNREKTRLCRDFRGRTANGAKLLKCALVGPSQRGCPLDERSDVQVFFPAPLKQRPLKIGSEEGQWDKLADVGIGDRTGAGEGVATGLSAQLQRALTGAC